MAKHQLRIQRIPRKGHTATDAQTHAANKADAQDKLRIKGADGCGDVGDVAAADGSDRRLRFRRRFVARARGL